MYIIHNFLQISPQLQSEFVMKAGLLVILLSGFIIYLTIMHRYKKNRLCAERKLQEQKFNQELLSSKVEVQEATFTSVGIELHDNVGQLVSTALMCINLTERNLGQVPSTLHSASAALNQCIYELRSLSKSLNKDWLEKFELFHNLQTEIDRLQSADLKINLVDFDETISLSPEQQFLLFRMLQEGIQNAVRHAKANKIDIRIVENNENVRVELRDNGGGFDTTLKTTGLGIPNMRQRANSLGGTVKWESTKDGTLITILLPIKPFSNALSNYDRR
jgi:signal transduction histidine kinase